MNTKNIGSDRTYGNETQNTSSRPNLPAPDHMTEWFTFVKSSRIHRRQKRAWQARGQK